MEMPFVKSFAVTRYAPSPSAGLSDVFIPERLLFYVVCERDPGKHTLLPNGERGGAICRRWLR
jgi:hypothetical protein